MTPQQAAHRIVMMVLLDFMKDVWMLPAPSSVTMKSVDMTHTLTWRPLESPCNTTTLYSVQFQGEFELLVLNGSWVDAPDCQRIPLSCCDLTHDLGSDSNYSIRVRAQCGSEVSSWSTLGPTFNRRDTVLTVPEMWVHTAGHVLQVSFRKLPRTAVAQVTVWKKDDELQADVHLMPAEQVVLQIPGLQRGTEYCVRARTVLDSHLHSGSTEAQCVSIPDTAAPWKTPTTVTVTVIITAGLLFAVFWSIVHCRAHRCPAYFHKEQLPRSLQQIQEVQILMSPQEPERCELIHMVQNHKD